MTPFELGKLIWEARIREAWGKHADHILARTPWPTHAAAHDIAAEHQLCIVQAKVAIEALGPNMVGERLASLLTWTEDGRPKAKAYVEEMHAMEDALVIGRRPGVMPGAITSLYGRAAYRKAANLN